MLTPAPSRHRRFKQSRVLIVGCGDVGLRAAQALLPQVRVLALTSNAERRAGLRAVGIQPLWGNLDEPASLARLAGLGQRVLHMAPPPSQGAGDPRTAALLAALARRSRPATLVYGSTTGVYGDAQGAWVDETRGVAPATDRGRRRVAAEGLLRRWGQRMPGATRCTVLRIPGIYALDRDGGDPRERVRRGSPVLCPADDVYTNHIHANDLARAAVLALWRARPGRVVHVSDDTELKMGDYFEQVALHFGLPTPSRVSRDEARQQLSPMQMSFMAESRRLRNARMKAELGLRLKHPTVRDGWGPAAP
ncbi:MAG: hypothetical protein RI907_2223 [Pseudomonadota bacterium]|jgi:nucleoside-diphosphate-sugar epimerase